MASCEAALVTHLVKLARRSVSMAPTPMSKFPATPNLKFTNAFTVEGWVNVDTFAGLEPKRSLVKGQDIEGTMDWLLAIDNGTRGNGLRIWVGGWQGGDCTTGSGPLECGIMWR